MKKNYFLLLVLLCFKTEAFANDFESCSVSEIVAVEGENIHVALSCPIANRPPCAIAEYYIGFDGTTLAGKYYFSLVSMALAQGLKLTGTVNRGTCAPQGNVSLFNTLRASK